MKIYISYALFFLWSLVILILSLMSPSQMPKIDFNLLAPDKIGHFTVYAIWAMLLGMAWRHFWENEAQRTAVKIALIGTLYGILIEFLQGSLTSNRTFDVADMFANAIGCIMGTALIYLFFRQKRKIA